MIGGGYDIFENMSASFALLQKDEITDISQLVQNQLQSFRDLLKRYFPNLNDFEYKLISNLFGVNFKTSSTQFAR